MKETTLSYEIEAANLNEMPEDLSMPDAWMFLALRNLYWAVVHQTIDRIRAKKEKQKLVNQYEHMKFMYQMFERNAKRNIEIGNAVVEYRRNKTTENADKILTLIYNMEEKQ